MNELNNSEYIEENKNSNKYLFEISWEVCNKVGGIYTVITSKLNEIQKHFNNNYYCIGPYLNPNNIEFEEHEIPEHFLSIIEELSFLGIKLHFGKWLVKGMPNTILIEYKEASKNLNQIKGRIWDLYKIDSLNTSFYDWDEPILFSYCAGIVIEKLNKIINQNILVHSHEWLAGGAILYLKSLDEKNRKKYSCIFTTHATMLGRSLCANNINLYDLIDKIDPDKKAYELGVHTKHQTEKVLANISDSFTTVSDITAKEAEFFYNKKPDILLYNGFNNSDILSFDKLNQEYLHSREQTNKFLESYFYNFYDINTDNSQIFFTSGRFEFENKGIDLLINSASKLNQKLKEENNKNQKDIIIFFLIMMGEFKQNKQIIDSINNFKNKKQREFDLDFAPLSTHEISTDNIIIKKLIENNLLNFKEDKVKVILIPEILNGNKNVFDLSYYEFTDGLDLGIFPSLYEPWGYTPLEAISLATPTITSNLSGFGKYIQKNLTNKKEDNIEEENAVKIIDRENFSFEESSNNLKDIMFNFTKKEQKDLLIQREESKKFALNFDWSIFIKNYIKAYEIAENKNNNL